MDLMYLPDAFTFHVIRSPAYDSRDYLDAAWEEEEEERRRRRQKGGKRGKSPPCANAAPNATESSRGGGHQRKPSSGGGGKDACPMCKERKRRTLATYIRTKSRQDSECTIEEEEEEGGEEGPKEARAKEGGERKEGNPTKALECAA